MRCIREPISLKRKFTKKREKKDDDDEKKTTTHTVVNLTLVVVWINWRDHDRNNTRSHQNNEAVELHSITKKETTLRRTEYLTHTKSAFNAHYHLMEFRARWLAKSRNKNNIIANSKIHASIHIQNPNGMCLKLKSSTKWEFVSAFKTFYQFRKKKKQFVECRYVSNRKFSWMRYEMFSTQKKHEGRPRKKSNERHKTNGTFFTH